MPRRKIKIFYTSSLAGLLLLFLATLDGMQSVPKNLHSYLATPAGIPIRVADRSGSLIYSRRVDTWNRFDYLPLHQLPVMLQQAFITAEDHRFRNHQGIDWMARLHATWQNVKAGRAVRGASTLTEQVVRLLHPRPRTIWSRWLEGWEAMQLEQVVSKEDILEFYLNQVPFASNRRGVTQAARYYFDRDPELLNPKEQLALAVLVRAPSHLDPRRNPGGLEKRIGRLARRMLEDGLLSQREGQQILHSPLQLESPSGTTRAYHFARRALERAALLPTPASGQIDTTLDGSLQSTVQDLLNQRLRHLAKKQVHHGAALVADHTTGEILAWVVGGDRKNPHPGSWIDAVTVPRQPGSSLKPFLYALALEKGWTAATRIEDSPLTEMVGRGLHRYHNYSRLHYGNISLREALGNSLNIPAVKTVQFVGPEPYLQKLRSLGFDTLKQHPDFYGDGLALGSGEVTLLDLVQAYAALANRGVWQRLEILRDGTPGETSRVVFSQETASIIGNILSDPKARQREFGSDSILNLPNQTAVKTGTSSDYRDAWAVGYNDRFVVGVWMGNLDARPTSGITGSTGPALVLRATFNELNRHRATRPLYLSPSLVKQSTCFRNQEECGPQTEWFAPGSTRVPADPEFSPSRPRLRQPTPGLKLARDPRIQDNMEAFEFILDSDTGQNQVRWMVDGQLEGVTSEPRYLWTLREGPHTVQAEIWDEDALLVRTEPAGFSVQ